MTSKPLPGLSRDDSLAMLVQRQVEAMDAWNVARTQREATYTAQPGVSREARLDFARRLDAVHCAHEAMLVHAGDFLARQGGPLLSPLPQRAVIAHRQEWFIRQLTDGLLEHGITVVAATNNGAEALGVVVAEQPDVLLVEDRLTMLSGAELVAEAALFAPYTIVAAQVRDNDGVGRLLNAGARTAFVRQVAPADIADALAEMVSGSST
jgi:CheY-like chemotaxis protein